MADDTSDDKTSDDKTSDLTDRIELEVEVMGTVAQVWEAVATGPGIGSWYVPHTVEAKTGGAMSAAFGPGPEMQVAGRVAVWEPPRRIMFDGGEGVEGLAFDWIIEPIDEATCRVRLINTGFGVEPYGDDYRKAMTNGWQLFLRTLQLHLEHFAPQAATSSLPMGMWAGPHEVAWAKMASDLGISAAPGVGSRVDIDLSSDSGAGPLKLGGTVVETGKGRIALLLDQPAAGTAFIAAEGDGDQISVSIWSYLYGEAGTAAAAADMPRWQEWLSARGV